MHYHDLQTEISSLEIQLLSHELLLDVEFSHDAVLKEKKRINQQLKILKKKLNNTSKFSDGYAESDLRDTFSTK